MPSHKTSLSKSADKRKSQLDAISIQLSSQRPSDVWQGMDQIRQWLTEDSEARDVYGLLLDAVQKNRDLREQVRNLLTEMKQKGSKCAEEAIAVLPSNVQDFLADADDAYYAAEYERAVQLYRQVLKLDPENERAKNHLAKAEIKRITGESDSGLPRAAVQSYRRARSYIAARDVVRAMNQLNAAIEAAQAKNLNYPEAEEALSNLNNLLVADDFRQKAQHALDEKKWKEALDLYNKAITLDPTNHVMQKELDSLQSLLRAETDLQRRGRLKILAPAGQLQKVIAVAKAINPENPLLKSIEKQLWQIKLTRSAGIGLLFLGFVSFVFMNGKFSNLPFVPASTATATNTYMSTATSDSTAIIITDQTATPIITLTATYTDIPLPTSTETLAPTPTEAVLGIGYIKKALVSTWEAPNKKLIERLRLYQVVTLLAKEEVGGTTWYRCRWNINGTIREGWILEEYITFGIPPTPRP